jgi:hypothetical protein
VARTPQPQSSVPRTDFTFTLDVTSHHNVFQSRPKTKLSSLKTFRPCSPEVAPELQVPKHCLTKVKADPLTGHAAELGRQRSHYFPLSAFLASPPSTIHQAAAKIDHRSRQMRKKLLGKQASATTFMSAQKEAASAACRALASQIANPASSTTPNASYTTQFPSPSPVTQAGLPLIHPITPGIPPLPITPPHTASPALSTSPVVGSGPLLAGAPDNVPVMSDFQSSQVPPPLSSQSASVQDTLALPSFDHREPASALSLITAPITSPYPFVIAPGPFLTSRKTSLFAGPELATPFRSGLPRRHDIVPITPQPHWGWQDFLKMGHANPCWCSQSSSPSCRSTSPKANLRSESPVQFTVNREQDSDGSNMTAQMVSVTLSPSSASSHFDFEDLGSGDYDLLTPSSSEGEDRVVSQREEEWTLVTPDNGYYTTTRSASTSSPELMSDLDSHRQPASVVPPNIPAQVPIPTPRDSSSARLTHSQITSRPRSGSSPM